MKKLQIHSKYFLDLVSSTSGKGSQIKTAIRAITHSKPLLVFWVTPTGLILDANNAHHDNPPLGDKSVLSDPKFKGHLRGRSALLGDKIYVVIYGQGTTDTLSRYQQSLLRRSYSRILHAIQLKNPHLQQVEDAIFITEQGADIRV